jgi:hypothetical protein
MFKRLRLLIVFASLSVTLGFMSNTYSRYVADTTSDIKIGFAKWQIVVNENDISDNTVSTINITPTMDTNDNIDKNTIAPSSSGYFDIVIDPTNVDVSFDYSISINLLNQNMPDLIISEYAFLSNTYKDGDDITRIPLENSTITDTFNIGVDASEPFTIRVFFKWFEGENENMDDEADTLIGIDAGLNNTELQIQASIHFEQKI